MSFLSGAGLGRKSVACIMLLCLRMQEFPVDVNVGRICSRLGWIPLDSELYILFLVLLIARTGPHAGSYSGLYIS